MFAARIRIATVSACTKKNIALPLPKTAAASRLIVVLSARGTMRYRLMSTLTPRKMTPTMPAMASRTPLAVLPAGSLKFATPLDTASMPASAVHPEAKARSVTTISVVVL